MHERKAAAILPLASGTAPAAKGVLMELVTTEQQPEALSAIALVETLAAIVTVSGFGVVFAFLSERGLARWTFAINAVLAWLSGALYLCVRHPRQTKTSMTSA